jgi:ferrous iron transport protein A
MLALRSINDLAVGQKGVVSSLQIHGAMRRRMLDIGLSSGAAVECVGESPLGDPRAYMICGAVIAIRRADGENVIAAIGGGDNVDI